MDDDPETLRKVRDALSKAGYLPIATGDPEEVPGLMEEHRPHLVLLDLVLPGVDGIELMHADGVRRLAEILAGTDLHQDNSKMKIWLEAMPMSPREKEGKHPPRPCLGRHPLPRGDRRRN